MTDADDVLGYCAAIIPDLNYWQANFITKACATQGERLLAHARTLRTPDGKSTKVLKPEPGVATHEQQTLGTLCAIYTDGMVRQQDTQIAAAAYALMKLKGTRFFVVHGVPGPEGIATSFEPLPVDSVDKARDYINGMPVVQKMKFKLIDELMKGARN